MPPANGRTGNLTIRINPSVKRKAKLLANRRGISMSRMIEMWIKAEKGTQ